MIDYAAIADNALAAIQEAGREIVVKRLAKDNDAITGAAESATAIVGTVWLVVLPVKSSVAEKLERRLQQALTEGRLRMLLVAASGAPVDLAPNDVFEIDGEYCHARGVTPLNPGGTTLIYSVIAETGALTTEDVDAIDIDLLEAAVAASEQWVEETLPADVL